ncbi:MAG: autotransporter-associated beta strand repeat-containing protein, partial [Thermoguttaceae bacterium]|nr:autotransporter-associated beta strand repeat-containing protein [Thermoguttaceae bacterium]
MKSVGLLIRVVCAGLMAGGQVWGAVIANYQGEYLTGQYAGQTRVQRQPDGWDYMWNSGGPIGTATNYTSLQWSTGLSVYNYDGGSPWPRGEPAAYVHLAGSGGHPGRGSTQSGGVGNTIDRYAIAAYTVQSGEQGHVYLANGSIAVASGGSNGVEVRVYVNDTLRFSRVQLGGAPTGYFGGYLGYLNAGDKVYVAVGPNNSDGADTFSSFQFILAHPDSTGDRWWDADGTAPVNGGSGTWNTTSPLWTDLPSGGTYGTWSNAANMTAHFAGTGGTVTLAEPITARALGFYTGGYTIAGTNTLTLTSSGTGSLGAATIYVENAVDTATISTPIAGSAGLIKTGAGTVVLANSSNTYTGTTYIQQGTVKLGANNAIPRIADNAVVNMRMENAVLDLNGYNEALHRIEVLGGTIQTGAGTLELTYSNSSFTSTSANSTLIAGTVKMTPNWGYFTFEVPDGPKDIDVEVSAKLTGTASG